MKLALLTYNLARTWDLDKIIKAAKDYGFAGIEFRVEAKHAHGVELERTAQERRDILNKIQDAYLEVACLGTSSRFENPDEGERRKQIDRTKQYIAFSLAV